MDPERVSVVYDLRRKLRKGHSEDVLNQFITLGGYSGMAALFVFILHIAMARLLGPADYAAYGTYLAILFTAFFSLTALHLVITRFISYHRSRYQYEQINYIITHALRILFIAGFIIFFIILLLSDKISGFFALQGIGPTVMLGFVLWFTMLVPVFEGAFKGLEEFRSLGRFRMIEAALRMVLAIVFVILGFSVSGAFFGLAIGTFVALMITYRHLYQIQKLKAVQPNLNEMARFAVPVFLTTTSLALLLNLDIILVKHYFPAVEAGAFAAASLVAKVPFLVSMIFVGVIFPKITTLHADGKNSAPILRHALQIVVPLVAIFTLGSLFFAGTLFKLLFGPQYAMGPALGFYVFGMGCLAVTVLISVYLLAVREDKIAFILPFMVALLLVLLIVAHTTVLQVMIVVMLVMAATLAMTLWYARNVLEFDYFL